MEIIALALGYVLGSIPFALLLTRPRGIDLRAVGSRNVGAANVLRTAGVASAVAVVLLDAAKGAMAVLVARLMTDNPVVITIAGLAAIVGHIYPAWLRFRGGKGVAVSAGVFAVLAPVATAAAALVFVATIVVTRFISAGSIAAAPTLAVAAALGNVPAPVAAGATLAAILVVHRHRDNLSRLITGTERRIGLRL
ncbi:MAG TPA: glycerol-3-phosphate 1-O-acyltransferase PlsY [Vicinamibacterales bacterium]|jgi:glycerol-3-phosphate acyltransferase PlsY